MIRIFRSKKLLLAYVSFCVFGGIELLKAIPPNFKVAQLLTNSIDPIARKLMKLPNGRIVTSEPFEDDTGVTCFSGHVAIKPCRNQINPLTDTSALIDAKLWTNDISAVKIRHNQPDPLSPNLKKPDLIDVCVEDPCGTTRVWSTLAVDGIPLRHTDNSLIVDASENLITSTRALLVNHINPVLTIPDPSNSGCFISVPNEDGVTCFSGNVGIDKELWVNTISPITHANVLDSSSNTVTDTCTKRTLTTCASNDNSCASINFGGDIKIRNKRIFGQVHDLTITGSTGTAGTIVPVTHFLTLQFDITALPLQTHDKAPGALIKVSFLGSATQNPEAPTNFFDVFYELDPSTYVRPMGPIPMMPNNNACIVPGNETTNSCVGNGVIGFPTLRLLADQQGVDPDNNALFDVCLGLQMLPPIPAAGHSYSYQGDVYYEVIGTSNLVSIKCECPFDPS